mgnify:CR=1 FL=1
MVCKAVDAREPNSSAAAVTLPHLPVDDALPELVAAVRARGVVVLVAPPGAGKTTRRDDACCLYWRGLSMDVAMPRKAFHKTPLSAHPLSEEFRLFWLFRTFQGGGLLIGGVIAAPFGAVAANIAVVACARYEHALPLARDDDEARALLTEFKFPFVKN